MIITYDNGIEVLACTPEQEKDLLRDYFEKGGRKTDDFDREEHKGVVEITAKVRIWS